jgi:hypothetical protein
MKLIESGHKIKRDSEDILSPAERVMGLEPTNSSLGSCCLTTWQHPQPALIIPGIIEYSKKSTLFSTKLLFGRLVTVKLEESGER